MGTLISTDYYPLLYFFSNLLGKHYIFSFPHENEADIIETLSSTFLYLDDVLNNHNDYFDEL